MRYRIYIPVWLDKNDLLQNFYLSLEYIYIPVWLDKNTGKRKNLNGLTLIYIPVWLDKNHFPDCKVFYLFQFTFQYG